MKITFYTIKSRLTQMKLFLNYKIFAILALLFFLCAYSEGGWGAQCWKKHNSGSIQTPDGEFKRPFGILCTYQCFLWFTPIFPHCEFIFELRLSKHFTSFPDCYAIRCNETFTFL
ncbi:uncharacterized protein LOC119673319 [Teleopsis dalmanni]|uniref:uncharacterized protein LOC119673319 n=1 Tax=Teleopsis dalmanni TaxID=139649 RepID=UPI0018CCBE96|nr:uncharacterized protein LOC119673319 [Teleopsis dalmanni]